MAEGLMTTKGNNGIMHFERGALMARTVEATNRALGSGALRPIITESTVVKDSGVDFQVRMISNLARKAEEKRLFGEKIGDKKEKPNPFLPYDEEMFVADISRTHLCLLNKFNVIPHHLLIVTREFEDQETLLTMKDFEAICTCIPEFEGLAFYNGGEAAGASQKHKHLQMIPLPMGGGIGNPMSEKGPRVPMEPLFEKARFNEGMAMIPGLPFVNAFGVFLPDLQNDVTEFAPVAHHMYRRMLHEVGLNSLNDLETETQSGPYNLLFTCEWMLLVPRSKEFFGPISVNALGFAGALLAKNRHEMKLLMGQGGMGVLLHTAQPL